MSKVALKAFGWVGIALTVISIFVSLRQQKKLKNQKPSYTYGEGALQTSVSNTAPVPIIYGKMKVAGNMIYSRLSGDKKVIYKIIGLADGPIQKISELKLDDTDANSSKFEGVSYDFYLGNGTQEIDSRVEGGSQEVKAQKVGGLKNLAYIALQAKANENLNGSFNTTCMVEGSIVKKYNNAEDLDDYVEEWTDNPAWCVLDFMTRFNGCGMDIEDIDVQSFIDASKFFEEKNYTLNLCLDEQRSRLEWIQYMLNCCRSLLVYREGKYSIFVEKEDEVVQSYTPSEIHDLSVWFSTLDDVPDIYRVTYLDPDNEWVKVSAEASLSPDSYLRQQPRVETLELLGVTNFDQASRLAWFYLNQALTCQTYVEFQTDRRALNRSVGDVIEVTDYITEFQKKKFRIIKIEDTQDESIKLTCREYNPNIYSEQRGATSPVINITTLADPQEAPPPIQYLYNSQQYYIAKDKTVVSNVLLNVTYADFTYNKGYDIWYRKQEENEWVYAGFYDEGTYVALIENMELYKTYIFRFQNTSKYGKVSEYTYSSPIYIEGKNDPPKTPENFRAEEVVGGFDLYWDVGEPDIDYYELYENSVAEENFVAKIYGTTYNYSALVGTYSLYLVAVDTVGLRSAPALLELEIERPADVSGFDCVQNERNIEFHWNKVEGASYYVLKEGENWEYGNILATSAGQFFSYPYAQAKSTTFWIKAYTDYGVPCNNPAYCQLTVAYIPNRNMIHIYDGVEDGWSGSMYNTHVNATGLQLDTGKVYGDYIYKIDLDQEYCARNWTERVIKPVNEELELQWKNAHFVWGSEQAKRRLWFPLGVDDMFNSWTEIATYSEANKAFINDRFSLNNTLNSDNGYAPLKGYGVPVYGKSRYENGLLYNGSSRVKWNRLGISESFSLSFILYTPHDSVNDYVLLTMSDDSGNALKIKYRASDDKFVTSIEYDGKVLREFSLKDFSEQDDFLNFMISQGDGYFTFVIYSLAFDSYQISRVRYTTPLTYTMLALYDEEVRNRR